MAGLKNFYVDLNLNQQELQNAAIHNLAAAPATPVAGQLYFDTATSRLSIWDGAAWCEVACLQDINDIGALIGGHDASGGLLPSSTGPGGDISQGDCWYVTVAGTLPAGTIPTLTPTNSVEVGDKIIATVDGAAAPGDFLVLQANLTLPANLGACESQGPISLTSGVASTITATTLSSVCTITVYDSTGQEIEVCVERTGATTFDLTSNVALAGLEVFLQGNV